MKVSLVVCVAVGLNLSILKVTESVICSDSNSICSRFGRRGCRNRSDVFKRMCKRACGICSDDGCAVGYYGKECHPCKDLCLKGKPECGRPDVPDCDQNCQNGRFGADCTKSCNDGCRNRTCDKWSGFCIKGCTSGRYGSTCQRSCPPGCSLRTCERSHGSCSEGCEDGWHGSNCYLRCPETCVGRKCDVTTGECTAGCIDGWYGKECQSRCPARCVSQTCDVSSGNCSQCQHGWFGRQCEEHCSPNCAHGSCQKTSGWCNGGCKKGTYGETCSLLNQVEDDGSKYSPSCDECRDMKCALATFCASGCRTDPICGSTCPEGCLNELCRLLTAAERSERKLNSGQFVRGPCTEGCKNGLYGLFCNMTCGAGCLNRSCEVHGSCHLGCVCGRHGQRCEHLCDCPDQGSCDRNGTCLKDKCQAFPSKSLTTKGELTTVWSLIALAFILGIMVSCPVFLVYRNHRKLHRYYVGPETSTECSTENPSAPYLTIDLNPISGSSYL